MVWGYGSALGVLALLGYAVSVCGAVLLWANRIDVPVWVNDEFGAVRRSLVRHAFSVSFHGLREELACKAYQFHPRAAALTRAPSFSALG
jgi:hypothetical protein